MPDKIEEWRNKRVENKTLHEKLIKKLSRINGKKQDQIADQIHESVSEQIDCLNCANCCKSIPPIINETDIRRISKHLKLKVTDFKQQYVKYDEDMDLVMKTSPCPFLEHDNKCIIYEARPKACKEYPHTGDFEFTKNLKLHAINSQYCPIVFHVLNQLMKVS